jgi:hypothetical protein
MIANTMPRWSLISAVFFKVAAVLALLVTLWG